MSVEIDTDAFFRRLNAVYSAWNSGYSDSKSNWQGMDAFITVLGKNSDVNSEERTIALHTWLLGYEFSEFVIIFRKDKRVVFIGGEKKLKYLNGLKDAAPQHGFDFQFNLRGEEEDNIAVMAAATAGCEKVGDFEKEVHVSALADAMAKHKATLNLVPLNAAVNLVMLVKDPKEIDIMSKAAVVSTLMISQLRSKCLDILDKSSKVSHKDIAAIPARVIDHPTPQFLDRCKDKYNIQLLSDGAPDFEVSFVGVQSTSGGFVLKNSATPTKDNLSTNDGNIVLSIGMKHKEYSVSLARTLLVNPTPTAKALYEAVYAARSRALERLSTGNTLGDVYQAIVDRVKANPEIQVTVEAQAGHGVGLLFYNSETKIMEGNKVTIEPHMTIYLSIVASNVHDPNECVWLADTVLVQEGNKSGSLMTDAKAAPSEVVFTIEDDDEEDDVKAEVKPERQSEATKRAAPVESAIRARPRPQVVSASKQIEEDQITVRQQRLEEFRRRVADGEYSGGANARKAIKKFDQLTAYKDSAEFPSDMKPNRIYVDDTREAVIVPINGRFVPFNAANIKNSTFQQEDASRFVLRINFIVPTTLTAAQKATPEDNPLADTSSLERPVYLKELLFKVANGGPLMLLNKRINDLAKKVKAKQKQQQDEGEMADNIALQLNKTRTRVTLKDLMVRPQLGTQRKMVGTLEAHQNGFRYMASKVSESIDIPYQLIKHAFFQRATEREPIVLVHFHLKHPIMLGGKKKTDDVQFSIEAGAASEDLGNNRRDHNEMAEEQRERMLRAKLNQEFERFTQEAARLAAAFDYTVTFEELKREMDIKGVPQRTDLILSPTPSALVHLVESFFVVTFDEVECVVLERFGHGLRNFDAIFVMKDFRRQVVRVDSVPIEYADILKRFLTDKEIPVWECQRPLKWDAVLKSVMEDVEAFAEEGGFESIFGEHQNSSDEEDDEEEEDSDYVPEGSSDGSSDESSDDSDSDLSDDDDSDSEYADEDEDEDDSWEAQERRFAEEDEEMSDEDEVDRRESQRKKSGSAGRKPGKR